MKTIKLPVKSLLKKMKEEENTTNVAVTNVEFWTKFVKNLLNGPDGNAPVAKFVIDKKSVNGIYGYISAYPGKVAAVTAKLTELAGKGISYWNMLDKFTISTTAYNKVA